MLSSDGSAQISKPQIPSIQIVSSFSLPSTLSPFDVTSNSIVFATTNQKSPSVLHIVSLDDVFNSAIDFETPSSLEERVKTDHSSPIQCLKRYSSNKLVSASKDSLKIWDVDGSNFACRDLMEDLGSTPHWVEFHESWVLVGLADSVVARNMDTLETTRFEGHLLRINQIAFFRSGWFLSVSDDRTFKVWSIRDKSHIYTSSILSSTPLIHIDTHPSQFRAVACSDTLLRFFDFSPLQKASLSFEPKEMKIVNVGKFFNVDPSNVDSPLDRNFSETVVVSSQPVWRRTSPTLLDTMSTVRVESEALIKGLHYLDEKRVFVGCNIGLVIMNTDNYEVVFLLDFRTTRIPTWTESCASMDVIGSYDFTEDLIVMKASFTPVIHLIQLNFPAQSSSSASKQILNKSAFTSLDRLIEFVVKENVQGPWSDNVYRDALLKLSEIGIRTLEDTSKILLREKEAEEIPRFVLRALMALALEEGKDKSLSFFDSIFDISPRSFLRLLVPKNTATSTSPNTTPRKAAALRPGASKTLLSKPVTFHSSIKSSGYSMPPPSAKYLSSAKKSKPSSPKPKADFKYPMETPFIMKSTAAKLRHDLSHNAPVTSLKYSADGKVLITASVDRTARAYRLSSLRGEKVIVKDLIGHNSGINRVHVGDGSRFGEQFSTLFLTSAVGQVKLWGWNSDALLDISKDGKTSFLGDLDAKFVYGSEIVLVSSGNSAHFYSYALEPTDPKSIKPNLNLHRVHRIHSYTHPGQNITATGGMNNHRSPFAFFGSSDKSLQIYDLATEKVIRTKKEAHTRSIHHIALPDYVHSPPSPLNNTFATMAITDGIKIWDLRSDNSVFFLNAHQNRFAQNVECSISPCGRYIASGSEDCSFYIYDIRTGGRLVSTKIKGGDAVNTIQWNPSRREVCTGDARGIVKIWEAE